jgi:hypothetical protein
MSSPSDSEPIYTLTDYGSGCRSIAERRNAPYDIDRLDEFKDFCQGVTHGMKLSIRADGEVEPCTVGAMGKGYGNIHNEPLPNLVNQMRTAPAYRLFEQGSFSDYLPYYSRSIFGTRFFRPCTFFGIISSLAAGVEQLRETGQLNQASI